jgi:hypothetical protein
MSGSEKGFTYAKLLRVNSANAASNTVSEGKSYTDWEIDLGSTCQQVKRVSFLSCVFTNTAYNIIGGSDSNNILTFSVTRVGGPPIFRQTITVPPGFYDVTDLMTYIEDAIQAILTADGFGETFTLTQNAISYKVSGTYDKGTLTNSTFYLDFNSNFAKSTWAMLGFTSDRSSFIIGLPAIGTSLPSLVGLRQVYLVSNVLSPGYQIDEKGKFQNVAINIPVTAPFGSVNVWDCKQDSLCEITYPTPRNLQRVDFKLTDEDGSIIDLNGTSVKIELKVWFNKT